MRSGSKPSVFRARARAGGGVSPQEIGLAAGRRREQIGCRASPDPPRGERDVADRPAGGRADRGAAIAACGKMLGQPAELAGEVVVDEENAGHRPGSALPGRAAARRLAKMPPPIGARGATRRRSRCGSAQHDCRRRRTGRRPCPPRRRRHRRARRSSGCRECGSRPSRPLR